MQTTTKCQARRQVIKSYENLSRRYQKHQSELQLLWEHRFRCASLTECFSRPKHRDSNPIIVLKCDLKRSMEKPECFQNCGHMDPPEIDKNQSPKPTVQFLVFPGAPGSSHGPSACPGRGCTRPA